MVLLLRTVLCVLTDVSKKDVYPSAGIRPLWKIRRRKREKVAREEIKNFLVNEKGVRDV